MNIREALALGRDLLSHSAAPEVDARLLLQHALNAEHSYLLAHDRDPVGIEDEIRYRSLLERARNKEPIPYIIGSAPFFDMDLAVTAAVLIPRPETEQLVETAARWAKDHRPTLVVDVGTGSGCIAISLARRLIGTRIEAVELSTAALEIARQNARRFVPGQVTFHQGSLLEPVAERPDLIVANLPYVTDTEWACLDDGVRSYEPAAALRGGMDGLDAIRPLLSQAAAKLNSGGAIFLEIGWRQGSAAVRLAQAAFPIAQVELKKDLAEQPRIVAIFT